MIRKSMPKRRNKYTIKAGWKEPAPKPEVKTTVDSLTEILSFVPKQWQRNILIIHPEVGRLYTMLKLHLLKAKYEQYTAIAYKDKLKEIHINGRVKIVLSSAINTANDYDKIFTYTGGVL